MADDMGLVDSDYIRQITADKKLKQMQADQAAQQAALTAQQNQQSQAAATTSPPASAPANTDYLSGLLNQLMGMYGQYGASPQSAAPQTSLAEMPSSQGGVGLNGELDKLTKGQQGGNNPISQGYDYGADIMNKMGGGSGNYGVDWANYGGLANNDGLDAILNYQSPNMSMNTSGLTNSLGGTMGGSVLGGMGNIFGGSGISGMGGGIGSFSPAMSGGGGAPNPILQNAFDPAYIMHSKPKVTYGTEMPTPGQPGYMQQWGDNLHSLPFDIQQSPWMSLALDKQKGEQSQLMNQAAQSSGTANAAAQQSLAMNGGLRSGAAERMARSGANDLATQQQGILGQGVINRANIGMQGAQMDTDINKFNSAQETNANNMNIGNELSNIAANNAANQEAYKQGMALKGAAMSAQATENAGKK